MDNKIVRDRVPLIAEGCYLKISDKEKVLRELAKKLVEESVEFLISLNIEELADVQEVLHRICELLNIDVERLRELKNEEKGGFKDLWFKVDCL